MCIPLQTHLPEERCLVKNLLLSPSDQAASLNEAVLLCGIVCFIRGFIHALRGGLIESLGPLDVAEVPLRAFIS